MKKEHNVIELAFKREETFKEDVVKEQPVKEVNNKKILKVISCKACQVFFVTNINNQFEIVNDV